MPIRPGEDWGVEVTTPPANAVVATTDREIADCLLAGCPVIVRGGSLHSSLGSPTGERISRELSVDLLEILDQTSGERLGVAVSNVLIRRRGILGVLRGRILLASNCGEFKGVSACPRAHPNDGHVDVLEVDRSMSMRQRRQAFRKAMSGSHLPHPALKARAVESIDVRVHANEEIVADGVAISAVGSISIAVCADAGTIFI